MPVSRPALLAVLAVAMVASGCGDRAKGEAAATTAGPATTGRIRTTVPAPSSVVPAPTATQPSLPSSSTTVASTSPASTTTSVPPPVVSGPTTTTPVTGQATPAGAATGLIGAWHAGDRSEAGVYADPAAVQTLFARVVEPVQAGGPCLEDGAAWSCPYFAKSGDALYLRTRGSTASGYRVAEVTTSVD